MASIKNLKKDINCLTEELITECFVFQHFHPEVNDEKLFTLLEKLTSSRNDMFEQIALAGKAENALERKAILRKVQDSVPGLLDIMDDLRK